MMSIWLAGLTAAAFVALPALAQDDDGPDYARSGIYFGVGVAGASFFDVEDDLEKLSGLSLDMDTSLGFDVVVGYRAVPHAAFEAEFTMLPSAEINQKGAARVAELDTRVISYNAKFFLLTGQFQPFAVIGFGFMHTEIEDFGLGVGAGTKKDFAGTLGAGADFYVTEHVAISADARYQYTGADLERFDAINFGAGLIYRF